jgi:Uri superfamily endonuclease
MLDLAAPIVDLGTGSLAGGYLLRVEVSEHRFVRFGRGGRASRLTVERGEYLYVGSAWSQLARHPLAARIARHLTRSAVNRPHVLYGIWRDYVQTCGAHLHPPGVKRMFWHIDYLLDLDVAEVRQIVVARGGQSCEATVAAAVERAECARPLARGLGASDHRGHTHILQWSGHEDQWHGLLQRLAEEVTSWSK